MLYMLTYIYTYVNIHITYINIVITYINYVNIHKYNYTYMFISYNYTCYKCITYT